MRDPARCANRLNDLNFRALWHFRKINQVFNKNKGPIEECVKVKSSKKGGQKSFFSQNSTQWILLKDSIIVPSSEALFLSQKKKTSTQVQIIRGNEKCVAIRQKWLEISRDSQCLFIRPLRMLDSLEIFADLLNFIIEDGQTGITCHARSCSSRKIISKNDVFLNTGQISWTPSVKKSEARVRQREERLWQSSDRLGGYWHPKSMYNEL